MAERGDRRVRLRAAPGEQDRELARPALRAARRGEVTDLPDDATFSDDDEVSYAVSWWACEFLATSFGSAGLWALLDELSGPATTPTSALQSITGLNTRTLARKAAKLIVSTYAPEGASTGGPASAPASGE